MVTHPYGADVPANDGFKIRGWDETGLHVGSARHFGRCDIRLLSQALMKPCLSACL